MASKLKQYTRDEYEKLAKEMDRRYKDFRLLREFYDKHHVIPEQYKSIWNDFQMKDAGLLWNEQADAVRTLWKTAKIHAKRRLRLERRKK